MIERAKAPASRRRPGLVRRRSRRPSAKGQAPRPSKGAARHGARKKVPLYRRRARTLLIGSVGFAAVVLGTSLPVSTLLAQHAQLSSTSKQLAGLEEQNRALEKQASQLSDPSTIADIARLDYGLVAPGSQAYEIVPSSGDTTDASAGSDYIPLTGPPVAPGSAQSLQLLGAGAVAAASAGSSGEPTASSGSSGTTDRSGGASTARRAAGEGEASGGFWTRVIHSLEFWR